MSVVTANDLKTKGVSAVEAGLLKDEKVIISVRGRDTYVVMDLHKYAKFKEYELEIALIDAKADIEGGRYSKSSVCEHMQQVNDEL
ncbi:prevent-host-death protein [Marinomonas sp. CT5]|uniref:type II toxin-antitoxin system Phd/YefM family antitoxin n=1 Tax=Marinomonas sp. CT5 TaxID=2066133 RepID=UPI001BB0D29A|nr:type II toxin-antitoxin system Phd/YefM family antitoxin [Marinomonas sp. CT5]QUX96536.1 prevent-host-death protein [Marinomonas sp. CT5]